MKKVEVKFQINVADDFEPGMCDKCPLQAHKSHEDAQAVEFRKDMYFRIEKSVSEETE